MYRGLAVWTHSVSHKWMKHSHRLKAYFNWDCFSLRLKPSMENLHFGLIRYDEDVTVFKMSRWGDICHLGELLPRPTECSYLTCPCHAAGQSRLPVGDTRLAAGETVGTPLRTNSSPSHTGPTQKTEQLTVQNKIVYRYLVHSGIYCIFLLTKSVYLSSVHLFFDVLHDMALHPSMMTGFQYAPSVGHDI